MKDWISFLDKYCIDNDLTVLSLKYKENFNLIRSNTINGKFISVKVRYVKDKEVGLLWVFWEWDLPMATLKSAMEPTEYEVAIIARQIDVWIKDEKRHLLLRDEFAKDGSKAWEELIVKNISMPNDSYALASKFYQLKKKFDEKWKTKKENIV